MVKRILSSVVIALLIMASVGCSGLLPQDSASEIGARPLWNAGNTRDKIIVLSDLHLGIEDAYSEILENRRYLVEFLERIAATSDVREVVLNGDVLDEWYLPLSFVATDRGDFYRKNLENNGIVLAALKGIINAGIKLVYVVGNHDMSVNTQYIQDVIPGIEVCSDRLGVGLYRTGDRDEIVIEHGHRYDAFSAPDTITNAHLTSGPSMLPPGYFYARFAADWVLKGKPSYINGLPVIKKGQEQNTPDQAGAYAYYLTLAISFDKIAPTDGFSKKVLQLRIDGYNDTYSIQDFFPVINELGEISAPVLYPNYQRTWEARQQANGVGVKSSFRESALGALDAKYFESQARAQFAVDNAQSDTSIVLFGHTHVPAFYDYGNGHYYVNTGTWIDHNTSYKEADGSLLSRTFAVVTTGASATVDIYQYRTNGWLRDLKSQLLNDSLK